MSSRAKIYLTWGLFLTLIAVFVARASAWELKHDYKVPLTKVCATCMADFAECMDDEAGPKDQPGEDRDPKNFVNGQLFCAKRAAQCTEDNKCGTRVVLDK